MNTVTEFNELIVPEGTPPTRIDIWLARNVAELSRRRAAAMLQSGDILVNGHPIAKSFLVEGGHRIGLHPQAHALRWQATPCPDLPLLVLYEDDALIAVCKPSGLPSVPLHKEDIPTLAGAIAARYPDCAPLGRRDGDSGLIGRLDTVTSGLLIAARTEESFQRLMALQRDGKIEKRYLALTKESGALPPIIRTPLEAYGRDHHLVRIAAQGEISETLTQVIRKGSPTLVQATIFKGFRHQIRVHLASCGAPIAADTLYNGPAIAGLSRLFLHSAEIAFPHPLTGKPLHIACRLPDDLEAVLKSLN